MITLNINKRSIVHNIIVIMALPNFKPRRAGYECSLWDKQHDAHIVRKRTLSFAILSKLVLIRSILNKIH